VMQNKNNERSAWPAASRAPALTPAASSALVPSSSFTNSNVAADGALGDGVGTTNAEHVATVDSTAHFATVFKEAVQNRYLRFVGTNALQPLTQWEIAPLTEVLVLVMLTIDSALNRSEVQAVASKSSSLSSGRAASLTALGYDDGIAHAAGRRFPEAQWDPVIVSGSGSGSGSFESGSAAGPPLRNVHWFLQGLRKLGDRRHLLMVWLLVLPLVERGVGMDVVRLVFAVLVGLVLAGPTLLAAADHLSVLGLATVAAWFVPGAVVASTCSWRFVWLCGAFLVASGFRSVAVAAAGLVAAVMVALPAAELVATLLAPLEPSLGVDLTSGTATLSVAASASAAAPAWATHSNALFVRDAVQVEWLNAHAVEFVPTLNVFPGEWLQLGPGDGDGCVVPPVSDNSGGNSEPVPVCTAAMLQAALATTKTVMGGPVSVTSGAAECGSCYGAETRRLPDTAAAALTASAKASATGLGGAKMCCNSCSALQDAYRAVGWDPAHVAGTKSVQCRQEQFLKERRSTPAQSRDSRDSRDRGAHTGGVTHLRGWPAPFRSTTSTTSTSTTTTTATTTTTTTATTTLRPRQAAHLWAELVQPAAAASGLALVAPAAGNSTVQVEWLGKFLATCFAMGKERSKHTSSSGGEAAACGEGSPAGTCAAALAETWSCDVEAIRVWSIDDLVWDHEVELLAKGGRGSQLKHGAAHVYWQEAYGGGRDGDFQRALASYLNGG
jgi:hypothetical protein